MVLIGVRMAFIRVEMAFICVRPRKNGVKWGSMAPPVAPTSSRRVGRPQNELLAATKSMPTPARAALSPVVE